MANRRDRERRRSAARSRAERRTSGHEGTVLRVPSEIDGFFAMKEGVKTIDILPYTVGKGNPFADEGMEYFERTFFIYRRIGPDEKSYVCPSKTFGERDYIQEWKQEKSSDPKYTADELKALNPKERQLFLVRDHAEPDKILLWEVSYRLFGELLDSRVKNASEKSGWEFFYDPDESGFSLRLTITEKDAGGFSFTEVTAIDFEPRDEPLPAKFSNHGICLDKLLVKKSYDELRRIFLGLPAEDDDSVENDEADAPQPKKDRPKKDRPKKVEAEEKPEPKKERRKLPTADDFDLAVGDDVKYDGSIWSIMKISGDGTSLILTDEDDNIEKAISPSDVKKLGKKKEKKEDLDDLPFDDEDDASPSDDEPAAPSSDDDFDDDDWDKDFD